MSRSEAAWMVAATGLVLMMTIPALVAGSVADRMRFSAYLLFSIGWFTLVTFPSTARRCRSLPYYDTVSLLVD